MQNIFILFVLVFLLEMTFFSLLYLFLIFSNILFLVGGFEIYS